MSDIEYWADLEARMVERGRRYPRSDPMHPEHTKWLLKELPNYGDAEKPQEARVSPPKRSRDSTLAPQSQSTRKRDTKLPRKRQGKP